MTKLDIIKALEGIDDNETITLGDRCDPIRYAYELNPTIVCGAGQAYMPYFCVREKGHEGDCYCLCKNVNFTPETPEEIARIYKEINEK